MSHQQPQSHKAGKVESIRPQVEKLAREQFADELSGTDDKSGNRPRAGSFNFPAAFAKFMALLNILEQSGIISVLQPSPAQGQAGGAEGVSNF